VFYLHSIQSSLFLPFFLSVFLCSFLSLVFPFYRSSFLEWLLIFPSPLESFLFLSLVSWIILSYSIFTFRLFLGILSSVLPFSFSPCLRATQSEHWLVELGAFSLWSTSTDTVRIVKLLQRKADDNGLTRSHGLLWNVNMNVHSTALTTAKYSCVTVQMLSRSSLDVTVNNEPTQRAHY